MHRWSDCGLFAADLFVEATIQLQVSSIRSAPLGDVCLHQTPID